MHLKSHSKQKESIIVLYCYSNDFFPFPFLCAGTHSKRNALTKKHNLMSHIYFLLFFNGLMTYIKYWLLHIIRIFIISQNAFIFFHMRSTTCMTTINIKLKVVIKNCIKLTTTIKGKESWREMRHIWWYIRLSHVSDLIDIHKIL